MFTLQAGSQARAEITVKRSRFIATLQRTDTAEQARSETARVKREFPDARHNCSAFVIAKNEGPSTTHSSDDGEPPGTAGSPILEVLLGASLVDVTAVVTRYFGGVLLGTGGLVRAYTDATRAAVSAASLVRLESLRKVKVWVPLRVAGRFEADVHGLGWPVLESFWGPELALTLALKETQVSELSELAADLSRSPATLEDLGQTTLEVPVSNPFATSTLRS